MDIDTLLRQADPQAAPTLRERTEVDRLIDGVGPRRRPRRRTVVGVAALSALLLAGGATASLAAGIWHPSWYDADSDWTTEVGTFARVFTVDGHRYHCTVAISLESTYNGTGTIEFQTALAYLRMTNPLSITPDPREIDDTLNATWVGQGLAPAPPSRAFANQQVWVMDVGSHLAAHLSAAALDPTRVNLQVTTSRCDATR